MNRRTIIILIFLALILFVVIPIGIDWLIIGNNIPSNISNSEWVGFFGAYVGAFFGAIVSLVGIILTIRFTNNENQKNRDLQVRPYCTTQLLSTQLQIPSEITIKRKILDELEIGFEPAENAGPIYVGVIYIKNIGLGPAVEFNYTYELTESDRELCCVTLETDTKNENLSSKTLSPNEEGAFPVYIQLNYDPIKEDDLEEAGENGLWPKHYLLKKYKHFSIRISFYYCDLFHNEYCQNIELIVSPHLNKPVNQNWQHIASIALKKSNPPELVDPTVADIQREANKNEFGKRIISRPYVDTKQSDS